ncbi:MAG: hypothetical protein JWQ07_5437 [Ramlibacter sp.]|nr:hypothetical protein [Ramlibacter sp.]
MVGMAATRVQRRGVIRLRVSPMKREPDEAEVSALRLERAPPVSLIREGEALPAGLDKRAWNQRLRTGATAREQFRRRRRRLDVARHSLVHWCNERALHCFRARRDPPRRQNLDRGCARMQSNSHRRRFQVPVSRSSFFSPKSSRTWGFFVSGGRAPLLLCHVSAMDFGR